VADRDQEAALIIVCPEAEPAVSGHRSRLDRAAQVGVPAHVTVTYPFKPLAEMTADDHAALETALAAAGPFTLREPGRARTGQPVSTMTSARSRVHSRA